MTRFVLGVQEVIQAEYHQQLFSVLIPTLEAPESRYVSPFSKTPFSTSSIASNFPISYPFHRLDRLSLPLYHDPSSTFLCV